MVDFILKDFILKDFILKWILSKGLDFIEKKLKKNQFFLRLKLNTRMWLRGAFQCVSIFYQRNFMRYNLTLEEEVAKKLKEQSEKTGVSELDLIRSAINETLCTSGSFIQIKFKKIFGSLNKATGCEDQYIFTYNPQIKTGKIESVKEIKKVPKCILDILVMQEYNDKIKFIKDKQIYAYSIRINENLHFIYLYDECQNIITNIADHVLEYPTTVFAVDRNTFMCFFEEVK